MVKTNSIPRPAATNGRARLSALLASDQGALPPLTPAQARTLRAWRRYKRLMAWMVLASFVAVTLAIIYLENSGDPVPIHMLIATVAGVGLSVLLGTALMGLVYFSNNSGHDENACKHISVDDEQGLQP